MFKNVLKVFQTNIFKSKLPGPLGRWCHKEYNLKCRTDIKSDFANIDNSGHMTGLCVKKKDYSTSKNKTNT